jgi:hypothetical protein
MSTGGASVSSERRPQELRVAREPEIGDDAFAAALEAVERLFSSKMEKLN